MTPDRKAAWLLGLGIVAAVATIGVVGCKTKDAAEQPARKVINKNSAGSTMKLSSQAFSNGGAIPQKHTGEGSDTSPPLAWSGAPSGTKSFALICDDPDAPSAKHPGPQPWVHWVIYNIPASVGELPEGVARDAELQAPVGARQGRNSWPSDNVGYLGPMPPPGSGPHRYFFKLYALDKELSLDAHRADKPALLAEMKGHVLAEAEWMGTYERQ